MTSSLIVSTYRAPLALDLVLCGVARQTVQPTQLVIADDGSDQQETQSVLNEWRARLPSIEYVWHVDRGFRKTRVLNEAVRRATGEYLLFLDGDCIPHRHYVADHLAAARPGRVLTGRRVKLGPKLTPTVTRQHIERGALESLAGLLLPSFLSGDTQRLTLGVRLPQTIARCLHPRARKLYGGICSMSVEAYRKVNGYDDAWPVYGNEDRDLEVRLRRAGYRFYPLLNRGIVYHLYHPIRDAPAESLERLEDTRRSGRVRCEVGVDSEVPFDPYA